MCKARCGIKLSVLRQNYLCTTQPGQRLGGMTTLKLQLAAQQQAAGVVGNVGQQPAQGCQGDFRRMNRLLAAGQFQESIRILGLVLDENLQMRQRLGVTAATEERFAAAELGFPASRFQLENTLVFLGSQVIV